MKEGHVKVTRTGEDGVESEVGVMVAGDFFGEGGFLTGEPTTANCIAVGSVNCAALEREAFIEILGSIEDVLAQNFSERVKHWEPGESMEMGDLVPVRRLGAGNFGRVDIVRHRVSGKTFALKQMLLRKVEAMDLQTYVENERAILGAHPPGGGGGPGEGGADPVNPTAPDAADLNCPFIVRLHGTFRTRRSLYLLMDYILGGELSRVLEETPALPPAATRFYAANLVLALKYMHGKWIVHRDLKPQNIMIEKNGASGPPGCLGKGGAASPRVVCFPPLPRGSRVGAYQPAWGGRPPLRPLPISLGAGADQPCHTRAAQAFSSWSTSGWPSGSSPGAGRSRSAARPTSWRPRCSASGPAPVTGSPPTGGRSASWCSSSPPGTTPSGSPAAAT